MQRALMQFFLPSNFAAVRKALRLRHREELIGFGRNALVPPERMQKPPQNPKKKGKQSKKSVDKRRRNG